jgi:inosine-uridine nucleoside N-ribohydrolase
MLDIRLVSAKPKPPARAINVGTVNDDLILITTVHGSASLSFTASNDRALLQRGYLNVLDLGLCSHKAPMPHHSIPPHLQGGP